MLQKLLNLSPISKNTFILILITIIIVCIAYIRACDDSLKKAREAYEHPALIHDVKIKKVQGPIRIIEKIVERPGGERIVERQIFRDPLVITDDSEITSKPAEVPMVAGTVHQGRYLLGASWKPDFIQPANATIWAGYSIMDRLDILAGAGIDRHGPEAQIMAITRWGH